MKKEAPNGAAARNNGNNHDGRARDIALLAMAVFLATIYFLREFHASKESPPISFVSSAEQAVFEVEYPGGVSRVYLFPKQESEIKSGSKIAIAINKDKEGSVDVGLMSGEKHIIFSIPLDINQAAAKDFEAIPGIGPKLAARIIEARENISVFKTIDDLKNIKGMGAKKFEKIKELVTADSR